MFLVLSWCKVIRIILKTCHGHYISDVTVKLRFVMLSFITLSVVIAFSFNLSIDSLRKQPSFFTPRPNWHFARRTSAIYCWKFHTDDVIVKFIILHNIIQTDCMYWQKKSHDGRDKPLLQAAIFVLVRISIFLHINRLNYMHNYRLNQTMLMTRFRTDLRHQYGIFGSKLQTAFLRNITQGRKGRRTAVFAG